MEYKVFGGKWSWPNWNTVLYRRVWNNRAVTHEIKSGKRCVISSFRHKVDQIRILLAYYIVSSCNSVQTFSTTFKVSEVQEETGEEEEEEGVFVLWRWDW